MTVGAVDRTEALELISACVGAVGGGDEDDVPFVTLDILKVFDEEGFLPSLHLLLVRDGRWIVSEPSVKEFFDELSLFKIERNDAERFSGMLAQVIEYGLDHHDSFSLVPAVLEDPIWDKLMPHAQGRIVVIGGREDDQVPLVKLMI